MLDCNLLTLAITDLQLWVLGENLISDMPISIYKVYDQNVINNH